MTKVLQLTLLAVAMSGLLAAPAFAGGGSTKSKPDLTVENETGAECYVVLDPDDDFIEDIVDSLVDDEFATFADAFNANGGRVLGDDEETVFKNLPKGDHLVCCADAEVVDAIFADAVAGDITVAEAQAFIEAEFEANCEEVDLQSDETVTFEAQVAQ